MSNTRNLRRQHDALQILVAEIKHAMADIRSPEQASECARLLAKLTGILRVHLAAEDQSLYPRMMASGNDQIARKAAEFSKQMGGLAQTYLAFEENWRTGRSILENIEDFRTEALIVFAALSDRIARENDELYPLADRMSGFTKAPTADALDA